MHSLSNGPQGQRTTLHCADRVLSGPFFREKAVVFLLQMETEGQTLSCVLWIKPQRALK